MDRDFCTLFDINYLPRGLVLYRSLAAVTPSFRLRVFCMDGETKARLDALALPNLVTIGLDELEAHDPALAAVKPTRTQVEYCWTATPAICLAALEREPELEAITYLDADLMFFADPQVLFDELGSRSILITPHRYAPQWQHHAARRGTYNVQFLTFRRDENGLAALRWWRDRCLEWCYDRVEDGKMGDQGYLEDWPERFTGVHVLEHPGGGLAPWNVAAHQLERDERRVLVDGRPLVFYHYHGLRLNAGRGLPLLAALPNRYHASHGLVWSTEYPVREDERPLVWEPYLARLSSELELIARSGGTVKPGFTRTRTGDVLEDTVRELLPAPVRSSLGGLRRAVRRMRNHRDSWKSGRVVAQHRELALRELERPLAVAPYRTFVEVIRFLVDQRPLPTPARLLDFGCGLGHYGEVLDREFPGRFVYTGCDYSAEMIAAARGQWPEREFVVNDVFANALDLSRFDVILASALVDVIEDHERALDVLLASPVPYLVLHRQRVTDGRSCSDVVPGYEGQTTYRSYLNVPELEQAARRHARVVASRFHVEGDVHSFILERTAA